MKYRQMGKTGETVSALGFGCMRLPVVDGDTAKIDIAQATAMVRMAIDGGLNYIDTAWPYHGMMSEPFVAGVLKDGYREKVKLATKLPSWLIKSEDDFDHYLNAQLEKLEVEQIDFYLVHAVNKRFWANMVPKGLFKFLDRAKADGRVNYIGFSFHDDLDLFKEVTDSYDWDFCQIQLNYIDVDHQQGIAGLDYAADKGLAVIIMEPLRGGKLVQVPDEVAALFEAASVKRTPVDWAMRWLLDNEKISLILSGMSEMAHVEENMRIFSESEVGCMNEEEHVIIAKARDNFLQRIKVDCTSCNYCMPCLTGVDIPRNFMLYNEYHLFDDESHRKFVMNNYRGMDDGFKANACVECGECESVCPQHLTIIDYLKMVDAELG